MDIQAYWQAALRQDEEAMRTYFHKEAQIRWHNTNEAFDVEEFIRANCEYPGAWDGVVERMEEIGNTMITVTHVFSQDHALSFHVTSFMEVVDDLIMCIDEYWGDDEEAPQWRQEKHIGKKIHEE